MASEARAELTASEVDVRTRVVDGTEWEPNDA